MSLRTRLARKSWRVPRVRLDTILASFDEDEFEARTVLAAADDHGPSACMSPAGDGTWLSNLLAILTRAQGEQVALSLERGDTWRWRENAHDRLAERLP